MENIFIGSIFLFPIVVGGMSIYGISKAPAVDIPLSQCLLLDAISLAVILFCLPIISVRVRKHARYCWGASVVFVLLTFTAKKWLEATLHFLGHRAAIVAWIRWPSVVILAIAIVVYLGLFRALFFGKRTSSLKRGITIRPLRVYEDEQEIVVGTFHSGLLPTDVQQFAQAEVHAKISLPTSLLTSGISILGDPGSGKSRLMRRLHDELRRLYPEIPVLIHDPKGEWLRTYYDPATDLIFAPNDKRSASWDIFAEIKNNPQLISSIVATAVNQHHGGASGDVYWINSAVALIKEQLETSSGLMVLQEGLLKWRAAHSTDKTALSAYGSARPAIKDLATIALAGGDGRKLTMAQFLNHRGRIFLLNNPLQAEEQSGAFAIFLSTFMLSCLSQPDTSKPRAVAIIDEALTFHLPAAIEQAVGAQSRSKGLITITGAQWIPKDERRLLTRAEFIFGMKVGDLATAKTLSELVGHTIYDEETSSTTSGTSSKDSHSSTSKSQQERKREVVPPESFRSLPTRAFILLHQAGIAPGFASAVNGGQNDAVAAFDYQPLPAVSEYMKVL